MRFTKLYEFGVVRDLLSQKDSLQHYVDQEVEPVRGFKVRAEFALQHRLELSQQASSIKAFEAFILKTSLELDWNDQLKGV